MILILAQRDLKIKYAQTLIGITWTLLNPITAVIVFTLFFHLVLSIKSNYPYVLFVLGGYLNWGLFNYIFNQATPSLINQSELIKKINFPKIIIPLSKCLIALTEFAITFPIFLILLFAFKMKLSVYALFLPIAVLPVILFSLGLSLILSSLTIKNRDLLHFVPFIVNFSIWLTPVFYPVTIVPEKYQSLLFINPITSSIHLFRNIYLGEVLNLSFMIGVCVAILFFSAGVLTFKFAEEKINDNI
jgi:lipopolysaccharide transport system permease protein